MRKLKIPAHEGYGAGGFPAWGIPPKATLLFEVSVAVFPRALWCHPSPSPDRCAVPPQIEVLSIKGKGSKSEL